MPADVDKETSELMRQRSCSDPFLKSDESMALVALDPAAPKLKRFYSIQVLNAINSLNPFTLKHEKHSWVIVLQAYHYLFQCYVVSFDPKLKPRERTVARNFAWRATLWTLGRGHHARAFSHFGRFEHARSYEYADAMISFLVDEAWKLLDTENPVDPEMMTGFEEEIQLALEAMLAIDGKLPHQQEEEQKKLLELQDADCKRLLAEDMKRLQLK